VFDDRGKYIYISEEEMQEMADFVSLRGRVSIDEIVDEASRAIQIP
jgi:DDRGK domain-containing protein 1